jgi:hypothetical protein
MRTIFFVPVILVIVLAAISLTARAADECTAKPSSAAPQGGHWYFRVNRSDHRHCWYVGPEGAKVHTSVRRAESPMPPGLISPAPVPTERPARTKSAEIDVSNDTPVDFAMRWRDLQGSYGSVVRDPSSAGTSYTEERIAADSEDDMPLIWPILTSADLAVASSPPPSAAKSEHMLAFLAGTLLLAAMIVRQVFKPVAVGRLGRSGLRDQRHSALNPNSAAALVALSRLYGRQAGQMRANRVSAPISAVRRATAERPQVALQRGA